eukprot:CAMPEP_0206497824 /NCGR_PEP_ID=MMETSP0324_2-20121206/50505_1 /ASSEMBLY_ACC=CAM_ASM_000836 /TAXON_ID=2866 /ORGANISM="Crypthecodinium cohnii, Strain Seligo" /LENGTH=380 /DNA_ID=CAMNT_0053983647 /DNA_START=53 /DNA_END=1192 /DNA_ORIENTATION=+
MATQTEAPRLDLAYLRSVDSRLDELAAAIQTSAVNDVVRAWSQQGSRALPKKVLVSGSSGYLGEVLVRTFVQLGVEVIGMDRQPGPNTQVVADICDADAVSEAARDCDAIFHTAALHAPNAPRHSEEEYVAVNVKGTTNLWNAAVANNAKAFIHTSTTSLMVTSTVKDIEARGGLAFLGVEEGDEASTEEPRNKYGRSKLRAEMLLEEGSAAAVSGPSVIVLRAPRFFPEDAFDSDALAKSGTLEKSPELSNGSGARTKALELLGTRTSLVDLLDAHMRAMALALSDESRRFRRFLLTPPALLERGEITPDAGGAKAAAKKVFETKFPEATSLFEKHGWTVPETVPRIYDGSLACRPVESGGLGWTPKWTFPFLLRALGG